MASKKFPKLLRKFHWRPKQKVTTPHIQPRGPMQVALKAGAKVAVSKHAAHGVRDKGGMVTSKTEGITHWITIKGRHIPIRGAGPTSRSDIDRELAGVREAYGRGANKTPMVPVAIGSSQMRKINLVWGSTKKNPKKHIVAL